MTRAVALYDTAIRSNFLDHGLVARCRQGLLRQQAETRHARVFGSTLRHRLASRLAIRTSFADSQNRPRPVVAVRP